MKYLIRTLALSLVLIAVSPRVLAQLEGSAPLSSAGTTEEALQAFLGKLQKAIQADNRQAVASLVEYPIKVPAGSKTVTIKSAKDFVAKYETIVTPDLKKTIAAARFETSWANWQGVMFESGRIWIRPSGSKDELRIGAINSPTTAPEQK